VDLKTLEEDWRTDPGLRSLAFPSVEELAQHLLSVHRMMKDGGGGALGYLYRKQLSNSRRNNDENRKS